MKNKDTGGLVGLMSGVALTWRPPGGQHTHHQRCFDCGFVVLLLILLFKASPNRVNKFEIIVPRIQNPVLIGTTYKENKNLMSIFVLYVCRSRREALING
jgi:hypothetical protein